MSRGLVTYHSNIVNSFQLILVINWEERISKTISQTYHIMLHYLLYHVHPLDSYYLVTWLVQQKGRPPNIVTSSTGGSHPRKKPSLNERWH